LYTTLNLQLPQASEKLRTIQHSLITLVMVLSKWYLKSRLWCRQACLQLISNRV